jgi:hypothetical protein
MRNLRSISFSAVRLLPALAVGVLLASSAVRADHNDHTSKRFEGVKANTGTVTHTHQGSRQILTLSADFKVPDAPAPHWQIVDSRGNVYLLQRLDIKDGKFNRQITIPTYIPDIARVQIWCAWAEALLGETAFGTIVSLR